MPSVQRTHSGTLLLPRPDRRHFAALPVPTPIAVPAPAAGPSRLEQLGLMTESVAHDFNNVLSVIMVCAGEIAEAAHDELQADRAAEIREAAERGAELSRRLLANDRIPEPAATPVAIEAAIVDALPLLRRTVGASTEITVSSEGHLPAVSLAPGELERMLVNLAANSRDAMGKGGSVAIRTGMVSVPAGDPYLGVGWFVRVAFSDNGAGMDPATAQRAVQPYFSTKPGHAGSGLGLATVLGLLRSRGGDLRINSAPGAGCAVSLYMPAVRASGEQLAL